MLRNRLTNYKGEPAIPITLSQKKRQKKDQPSLANTKPPHFALIFNLSNSENKYREANIAENFLPKNRLSYHTIRMGKEIKFFCSGMKDFQK